MSSKDYKAPIAQSFWPGVPRFLGEIPLSNMRSVDQQLVDEIQAFISASLGQTSELGLERAVIGLSGGLDSGCAAALCLAALGPERVTGVIVDLGIRAHEEQTRRSVELAEWMDLHARVVDASALLAAKRGLIQDLGPFSEINIITRCIQDAIFQVADSEMAAVVSTTDRSEALLGRHTEHFYGHLAPLIGLFKTDVLGLARACGLPRDVIEQEPGCTDAWLDREVLGAGYEIIDPILYLLVEEAWTADRIADEFGMDPDWLRSIEHRVKHQPARTVTRAFIPPPR